MALTLYSDQGYPLTTAQLDANFEYIDTDATGESEKNKVTNGNFRLARDPGPLSLTTTPTVATVDGWFVFQNTASAGKSAQADSGLSVPGLDKCLKIGRNQGSSSTDAILIIHSLNTVDSISLAGQPIVFSFYAKGGADFSGSNINIYVASTTTPDQQPANIGVWSNVTTVFGQTQDITGTFSRYSLTTTCPSGCKQLGIRMYYVPTGTAGADDNLYITGVRIEIGSAASTHKPVPAAIQTILSRPFLLNCGAFGNLGAIHPFSACQLVPRNGNLILINGRLEVIPDGVFSLSGGVSATYTNCSADKILGSTLNANTLYRAYAYMLNGVMTIDFSTNPQSLDPEWGIWVKNTDRSCTLIGLLRTDSNIQTYGSAGKQTIVSHFNKLRYNLFTNVSGSTNSSTATELDSSNRIEWVQWSDDLPRLSANANLGNSIANNGCTIGIGLSSSTTIYGINATAQAPSTRVPSLSLNVQISNPGEDAYHYAAFLANDGGEGGTGTLTIGSGGMFLDNMAV